MMTYPENSHAAAERDALSRDIVRLRTLRYETEVLCRSFLPAPFVLAYQALCDDVFRGVGSALGNVTDMPQAPRANAKGKHHGGLTGNEQAMRTRKNIDRKLRALTRDIRSLGQESLRCPTCSKFIENGWKHCAWCGKGLEDEGTGND